MDSLNQIDNNNNEILRLKIGLQVYKECNKKLKEENNLLNDRIKELETENEHYYKKMLQTKIKDDEEYYFEVLKTRIKKEQENYIEKLHSQIEQLKKDNKHYYEQYYWE